MTSLTHPADYSVAELTDELEQLTDAEELERLLEVEREGENRVTAIDAIEQRLEAVAPEDADSDVAEPHEDVEDAVDEAAEDDPVDGAVDDDAMDETADDAADAPVDDETVEDVADSTDEAPIEDEAEGNTADAGPVEETWSKDTGTDRSRSSHSTGRSADVVDEPEPPEEVVRAREEASRPFEGRDRSRFGREDDSYGAGRVEARIRQLQTEVSDLKAYRSALEEFLDEEGTGRQVIESLRGDIATVEADIAELADDARLRERDLGELWGVVGDVENELSQIAELLNRHHRDLEAVAADVDTVESDLHQFRESATERHVEQAERLDGVDERLDGVDETLDDVDAEVASVSEHVDAVDADVRELDAAVDERFDDGSAARAELSDRIDENAEAIDALRARVDDVADSVADLEETVGDSGHVDQRFDSVEEEIRALKEWREQLSSVLLGSAGGDPGAAQQ